MEMFIKKDNQIVYDGYHMEAFIPADYFTTGLGEEVDAGYLIFGNFVTLHHSVNTEDRKKAAKASFELPVMFVTLPDSTTSETIDMGHGMEKFKVLHYYKGSVVIQNSTIIQSPNNEEKFMTLLFEGKLDNVQYDRIASLHNMCKKYNGVHLQIPAMYDEIMVAQTYRDKTNLNKLARFTAKSHGTEVTGMTLREKAAFINTFSGINFEDTISMLTVADNSKRENREEVESDIEKIILDRK